MNRKLYNMSCKKCSYKYQYKGEYYEWESCPLCSHNAPFKEFVDKVHDAA